MFPNVTLAQRITFGFIMVICIMGLAIWSAEYALRVSQQSLSKATEIESTKIRDVARMVQNLIALQRSEKNLILSKSEAEMDEYEAAISAEDKALIHLLATTKPLVTEQGAVLLTEFEQQYNRFRSTQEKVINLSRENGNVKAQILSQGASRDAYDIASNALNQIVNLNDLLADKLRTDISNNSLVSRLSASMVKDLLAITRAERNLILSSTQEEMDEYATFISATQATVSNRWERLRELLEGDSLVFLDGFWLVWEQFLAVDRRVQILTRENGNNKAQALSQGAARIAFDATVIALDSLMDSVDLAFKQAMNLEAGVLSLDRIKLPIRLMNDLLEIQRGEKNVILSRSDNEMNEYTQAILADQADLHSGISLLSIGLSDNSKSLFDEFLSASKEYLVLHNKVLVLSRLNSNVKAFNLATNKGRYLADQAEQWLSRLTNKNDAENSQLLVDLARTNNKVKLAAQINRNLTEMQRGEKNIILVKGQGQMDSFSISLSSIRAELENRLRQMTKLSVEDSRGYQIASKVQKLNIDASTLRLSEFKAAYKSYRRLHVEVRALSRLNSNVKALELSTGIGRYQFDLAQTTLTNLVNAVDEEMSVSLGSANEKVDQARLLSYIISVVAVLVAIGIIYFTNRSLILRTKRLAQRAQLVAIGQVSSVDQQYSKYLVQDELSPMDNALDLIDAANQKIVEISNAMAVGNLSLRLTARSNDDPLVDAINQMADNSKEVVLIANTIAGGDLSTQVVVKSEQDQLALAIQRMLVNLRHATAAKDQFLTSMSHELCTPLNAIIGLSKALVSDTEKINNSQKNEYLHAIHGSGQHLLNLIGDILDLSKLNAGARSLEKQSFTILQLMEECRNTFAVACQDKGVSLNIDNQLNGPYPVLSDMTILKQILYNLLGNAVKFTQQGTISLTAVAYDGNEIDANFNSNAGIMFIVEDTGKGINADAIEQLFDPFTQEDNGITRSFGGSGLGLNIAQELAKLMGGKIRCNSIVGKGSIFEVVVYLEQQPRIFEMLDFNDSDSLGVPPLKLLIVDDVPLNLMVAVALLKPKGHVIETASNGQKALEMASNNDYDAILMDVHMPGMDGMETTKMIRNFANKHRAAVPIVALSADVNVTQQSLFIASGMNASVGKPWEVNALEKELKRILKLG